MTTTTSFDTPRVFGHHNPFASFSDTTEDPLATTSTSGFGTSQGGNSNSSSADPWSSYYNAPIASTSSNTSNNSALSNVVDENSIPGLYSQAWIAALAASSNTTSSFGSTFNTGNTISLATLQKVLSGCAGLGASETEKVRVSAQPKPLAVYRPSDSVDRDSLTSLFSFHPLSNIYM